MTSHSKISRLLLCRRGFHKWSWKYLDDGSCKQERMCSRCLKTEERVQHQWMESSDYDEAIHCTQPFTCARCKGNDVHFHSFDEIETTWVYQFPYEHTEGEEIVTYRCRYCGKVQ